MVRRVPTEDAAARPKAPIIINAQVESSGTGAGNSGFWGNHDTLEGSTICVWLLISDNAAVP
jgi:hypothetical protein